MGPERRAGTGSGVADATGEDFCFEKYMKAVGSANKGRKGEGGFGDVWMRGCIAWE